MHDPSTLAFEVKRPWPERSHYGRAHDAMRPPVSKGDTLLLREWDPARGLTEGARYTGRRCVKRVTYVLHGGAPGMALPAGVVVMGLAPAHEVADGE